MQVTCSFQPAGANTITIVVRGNNPAKVAEAINTVIKKLEVK